jgi:hypothetical protein
MLQTASRLHNYAFAAAGMAIAAVRHGDRGCPARLDSWLAFAATVQR